MRHKQFLYSLVYVLLMLVQFSVQAQPDATGATQVVSSDRLLHVVPAEIEEDYDPNIAPLISGDPSNSVTVGERYEFSPKISDADQDLLTLQVSNLPGWAKFDPQSGAITGKPAMADVGSYRGITIVVSDGLDDSELGPFGIDVVERSPQAPLLNPLEQPLWLPTHSKVGTLITTLSASDQQGDQVTFSLLQDHPLFSLDPDGKLLLRNVLDHNGPLQYKLQVQLSDGSYRSTAEVVVRLGMGNGVWQQRWDDLPGDRVSDLLENARYPASPDATSVLDSLSLSEQVPGQNARRLISYLKPAQSGDYVFSINGNGDTQLRLSPSYLAVEAVTVAQDRHTELAAQRADSLDKIVNLQAGQIYYLEVLDKQQIKPDAIEVRWKLTSSESFSAIPAEYLYLDGVSVGLTKPIFLPHDTPIRLDSSLEEGVRVSYIPAIDLQSDALEYFIDEGAPFSVDQYGVIRTKAKLTHSTEYNFTLTVSDGTHPVSTEVSVITSPPYAVDIALASGDASNISEKALADKLRNTVDKVYNQYQQARNKIFAYDSQGRTTDQSLRAINWNPTERSVVYEPLAAAGMFPLLVSNVAAKQEESNNEILAMAGVHASGARRAVLASNAFHDMAMTSYPKGSGSQQMNGFLKNLIAWLVDTEELNSSDLKVVIAHQADTYYFKHDASTASWFTQYLPSVQYNAQDTCESNLLQDCLEDADLLIMGRDDGQNDNHGIAFDLDATMHALTAAHEAGLPILYLPFDSSHNELGDALLDYFAIATGSNFWRQERLLAYNPRAQRMSPHLALQALPRAINYLTGDQLKLSFDQFDCYDQGENVNCDTDRIAVEDGVSLQDALFSPMGVLHRLVKNFDLRGVDIFSLGEEYRIEKLCLLLADKYRQQVQHPMDKLGTKSSQFFQALFADHAVHYARANNVMQADVGTFTSKQQTLSMEPGKVRTIRIKPDQRGGWQSTGLYAPPGRAVRVSRKDSTAQDVQVRFNMHRRSPRLWNEYGYHRPLYLSSNPVALAPAQSLEISTPYGGPIYIWSSGNSEHDAAYTIEFANVLDNPRLSTGNAGGLPPFYHQMMNSQSDWVDLSMPFLELHSTRKHIEHAFDSQDGDTTNDYTSVDVWNYLKDLEAYLINSKLSLAGYSGEGLVSHDFSISQFCSSQGLSLVDYDGHTTNLCTDKNIHRPPAVEHIISENIPRCTGVCRGSPIHIGSPISLHDWQINIRLSQLLPISRQRIYGSQSRDAAAAVFPLYTHWLWARDQGLLSYPGSSQPAHRAAFDLLQEAARSGITAGQDHPLWRAAPAEDNLTMRLSFYMQLMYTQQSWSFFTKVNLIERIFNHALQSNTRWAAVKDLLGFGLYSRDLAATISGNDFMYIVASKLAGRDYREFFTAWGIQVSQAAFDQITASQVSESVPTAFYYVEDALPVEMPSKTILLDGWSAYR